MQSRLDLGDTGTSCTGKPTTGGPDDKGCRGRRPQQHGPGLGFVEPMEQAESPVAGHREADHENPGRDSVAQHDRPIDPDSPA
ncbi:hypothetical protein D3C85_598230 [compost metagenome]